MTLISRLRAVLLVLVLLPLLTVATPPRAASAGSTYYLQLFSLKCTATEDWTGPDEPYLIVGGKKVWGPLSMNSYHTSYLTNVPEIAFDGEVKVALYDEDSGVLDGDDWLGTITISGTGTSLDFRTVSFTRDGAHYELSYYVQSWT